MVITTPAHTTMTRKRPQKSWTKAADEDFTDFSPAFSKDEENIDRLFKMGFVSLEEIDYLDPNKVENKEDYLVPKATRGSTWSVSAAAPKKTKISNDTQQEEIESDLPSKKSRPKKKQKEKSTPPAPAPVPVPSIEDMIAWTDCCGHLDELLLAGLKAAGFLKPLEIQKATLKASLVDRKRTILASAPTGSGKTLAFALPILNQIYKERRGQSAGSESATGAPTAIIIVPTRELAIQIEQNLRLVTKFTPDDKRLRLATVIGGMAPEKQSRLLNQNPEIIIATPGRFAELVEFDEAGLKTSLKEVRFVVLDEADRLIQPGHFKELDDILSRILGGGAAPSSKSVFLFSATLVQSSDPKAPFSQILRRLSVPMKSISKPSLGIAVLDFAARPDALEEYEFCCRSDREEEKIAALIMFLKHLQQEQAQNNGNFGRILLFVNAIDTVRKLTSLLSLLLPAEVAPEGLLIAGLHAQLQQRQRLKNLERFKARQSAILVATDVAARGLDIPAVDHVIHYHLPRNTDTYIHRCGRTARAMRSGRSLVLLTASEARKNSAGSIFPSTHTVHEFAPNKAMMYDLVLPAARQAMFLESASSTNRKQESQQKWAEKAADDLGIILEEDNDPSFKKRQHNEEGQVTAKELARAQAELSRLLILLAKQ